MTDVQPGTVCADPTTATACHHAARYRHIAYTYDGDEYRRDEHGHAAYPARRDVRPPLGPIPLCGIHRAMHARRIGTALVQAVARNNATTDTAAAATVAARLADALGVEVGVHTSGHHLVLSVDDARRLLAARRLAVTA